MTLGELKSIVLQKVFISSGDIVPNDQSKPYIDTMTAPINEGLNLLFTSGKPVVRQLDIELMPGDTGQIWLNEKAEDYYMPAKTPVWYYDDGVLKPFCGFSIINALLTIRPFVPGRYRVFYYAFPPKILDTTPDSYELPIPEDMAVLLPLYVASQIYKDDDIVIANGYRSEFEAGKNNLNTPSDRVMSFSTNF